MTVEIEEYTPEDVYRMFENIRNYCAIIQGCTKCRYYKGSCIIKNFTKRNGYTTPKGWNLLDLNKLIANQESTNDN